MPEIKVLSLEEIEDELNDNEIPENGILSSNFIPIKDLEHFDLVVLFEQSPDWVATHRPDWVKQNHPELIN